MKRRSVSYDSRSIMIDRQRLLMISGAIHYARSTPRMWPELLRKSRQCGLNTVETYVFWGLHEHRKGHFDFTGRGDLRKFLRIAEDEGLHVILRVGPYVCAEWNFGGLPAWLINEPGMEIRTLNRPFMAAVERWLKVLFAEIDGFQHTQGGPVIMVQPENEYFYMFQRGYGKAGRDYLKWMRDVFLELGVKVPLIMCKGGSEGVIETLNSFAAHEVMNAHRTSRPEDPLIWTELYSGFYDIWGHRHRRRDVNEMAAQILRFVSSGGTGFNYYMWHGGTSFERTTTFLQTTSYDFDAPLDEFGRMTPKAHLLAEMHKALKGVEEDILGTEGVKRHVRPGVSFSRYGKALFVDNRRNVPVSVDLEDGETVSLAPDSVKMFRSGRMLFDTAARVRLPVSRKVKPGNVKFSNWKYCVEPIPKKRKQFGLIPELCRKPVSMLRFSGDNSDYGWYSCEMDVGKRGLHDLILPGAADMVHIYIDGKRVCRVPDEIPAEYRTQSDLKLNARIFIDRGTHRLDLLCVSLGLVRIDHQIDANMVMERKGLWLTPRLDGRLLTGPWELHWGLLGERGRWFDPEVLGSLPWRVFSRRISGKMTWFHSSFRLSMSDLKKTTSWKLMCSGGGKGFVWVNGFGLGRYWLIASDRTTVNRKFDKFIQQDISGGSHNSCLHVPVDRLVDGLNHIVVFEEEPGDLSEWRMEST